jgi:hypothetical protein
VTKIVIDLGFLEMSSSKQPLAIYLQDHLAGAAYALDLVESMRDNFRGQQLGDFAAMLYVDIAADKEVLHALASQLGPSSDVLKDTVAWLAEKISRFKLAHDDTTGLRLFEALEFLALGIHGKASLWRALAEVREQHDVLARVDFANLVKRAEQQVQAMEKFRLAAARNVFAHLVNGSTALQ